MEPIKEKIFKSDRWGFSAFFWVVLQKGSQLE